VNGTCKSDFLPSKGREIVENRFARNRILVEPGRSNQGVETETLWAKEVGPNLFRIENSPFFIFGISADDIVSAEEVGGRLKFQLCAGI
jgi:hypothetical protein